MRRSGLLLALVLAPALALAACATRHAVTTWGYSHWYDEFGGGSMGSFEKAQKQCLEQAGAAADPAAVAPDSAEENAFIECMNGAHWCTSAYHCAKPGL